VDWWYAQNTILYLRDGGLSDPIRALVHPGLLAEVAEAGETRPLRRLFRR